MALMPGIPVLDAPFDKRSMDRYDIVCVHTIVGFAPAHAAHFSVKADGTILQSRDTRWRSAANLDGNPRVIAIENEDHGPAFPPWTGSDVPPLTDAQVEANAAILRWAHETHGIPLQLCPDSRSTSRGLAYHRQGIDGDFATFRFPGRVAGGEVWTTSPGKVCPGDRRIAQLPEILRIAQGDDVTPEELRNELKAFGQKAGDLIKVDQDGKSGTARISLERALRQQRAELDDLKASIPALIDKAVRQALADSVVNVNVTVSGPNPE